MKRPASLLAALLCLLLSAHTAAAQSANGPFSYESRPQAERDLHDRKLAAGQIIEPLPGESQQALVSRARERFAHQPQYSGQASPSSIAAHQWPDSSRSSSSRAGTRPSSGSAVGFGLLMIFLFALIFLAMQKMFMGVFRLARVVSAGTPREEGLPRELDHLFFDQHVAKRLAELQAGGPVAETADSLSSHPPAPAKPAAPAIAAPAAVRGFGRKV